VRRCSIARNTATRTPLFSFERGIGGEAGGERKTHNDWDVVLGGQSLNVVTVVDDQSLIVDLGPSHLVDLLQASDGVPESAVRLAAERRYARERDDADKTYQSAPVNVRQHVLRLDA
jgi:hypothetical protein